MSDRRDFLVEIGTEELPPKALRRLDQAFRDEIRAGLEKADLDPGEIRSYASPRRLAVWAKDLRTRQSDKEVVRRGPALTAAFGDDGLPSKAAMGFARSCGVSVDDLEKEENEQGAWLAWRSSQKGRESAELLPEIVEEALRKLPIPKRMRWGDLDAEFVRPVHWVVLLLGDQPIEADILGIASGQESRGHRFHHPQSLFVANPAGYEPLLASEGRVLADFNERREAVRAQVMEAAARLGGIAQIDEALLDEVTGMVEWPVAVVGKFEQRFLEVPPEVLITTMKVNQKYFHLVDDKGALLPNFITISNIESKDPAQVAAGNERVVRPRLADADFFWNQDRKQKLDAFRDRTRNVVFQNKLGSLYDKSERVAKLAAYIAGELGGGASLAQRAGELCKCDLMTEMVGEFPELQGIMGRYYAEHGGEPAELAQALDEQYMPRFAGDELPATPTGQALAIADKLDTLCGLFGIGQPPSGDKDPFGLRRAALGVLRICVERDLPLSLPETLAFAVQQLSDKLGGKPGQTDAATAVYEFMMERLRRYYADAGIEGDVFEAVLERRPARPDDFHRRMHAVAEFRELPEAKSLAAANKRIANILKKAEQDSFGKVQPHLFESDSERSLSETVSELSAKVKPLFAKAAYGEALRLLAALREPVDAFFDEVMVMADDPAVRENRLALLASLRELFLGVADVSRLRQ